MSNPQQPGKAEETFEDYMRNARDEFVMAVKNEERSNFLLTAIDSFLICFDQMREKLTASPKGKEEEELKELRAWKESAMRVMPDFQAIGKELGLKLGDTVHDKILPAIINYKKQLGITG